MSTIRFVLVFAAFGCGRTQSPADAIALGRASHACNDGGMWDGLECAKPHEQPEADEPAASDRPKATPRRRANVAAPEPLRAECDCEPDDPLCSCAE
jgi:hypothetical protein